jgi:hypothetical protein
MIKANDPITIIRPQGFDRWGEALDPIEIELKARIDMTIENVTDQQGNENVSKAQILFKGLVEVRYDDTLKWTDEFGNEYVEKPLSIAPIKNAGGKKVVVTKVVV